VISFDLAADTAVAQDMNSNSDQILRKPVKLRVKEIAKLKGRRMTPNLIW